jgi:hypothetical protein
MKGFARIVRRAGAQTRTPFHSVTPAENAALDAAAGSLLFKINGRWRPQNSPSAASHDNATIERLVRLRYLFMLDENNSASITFAGRRHVEELHRRRANFERMKRCLGTPPMRDDRP